MEIWKTPLLFCAVVFRVTSAIMIDEISSDSIASDDYKNGYITLRSLVEKYVKMLKDGVNVGISTASSACIKDVILKLFEANWDILSSFDAELEDLRYECATSPPSVEHASVVVTNVNATQQVAKYTCDTGFTYGGGKREVWCEFGYGVWGSPTLRCIECFTIASAYQGKKSTTRWGIECQRWDSQSPHRHNMESSHFPEQNISSAKNYCRAPSLLRRSLEPWCYTADSSVEWDYCDIPYCKRKSENDCGLPKSLTNAELRFSYTSLGARATYMCLTLSGSTQNSYCPVSECTNAGWTTFSISCGEHDCFRNSQKYIGKRHCTSSGRICQKWKSTEPHDHRYVGTTFPDGSSTQAGNYCRDPDGSGEPWCYTTDLNVRYERCDVPSCDKFP